MSKFIVIEGTDGSGKATQTKLLIDRLKQQGQSVKTFAFPRHGQKFFGILVDKYLNNEFGDAAELDPHIASLFFACDRWEVKDMINDWLKHDHAIILDRYATSNMAHQAGKIKNLKKRDEFLNWLDELEFQTFKIPRPDLVLYLDVPVSIICDLMDKRDKIGKEYINGDKDGLENNKQHLEDARQAYLYLCQKYSYWKPIKCTNNNQILTKEQINDIIWETINQIKN